MSESEEDVMANHICNPLLCSEVAGPPPLDECHGFTIGGEWWRVTVDADGIAWTWCAS